MYKLTYYPGYEKRVRAFLKKHPLLHDLYYKALHLLESNPFHPSLRLHALQGKFKGYHSVSINMKYRMTIDFLIQDQEIILLNIGDHHEVYR